MSSLGGRPNQFRFLAFNSLTNSFAPMIFDIIDPLGEDDDGITRNHDEHFICIVDYLYHSGVHGPVIDVIANCKQAKKYVKVHIDDNGSENLYCSEGYEKPLEAKE